MNIGTIAAQAYLSPFYFQRIFSALCGLTVGEYVRNRRMTLAAEELSSGRAKVIDIAIKYGYDSPDSFSRAFARFHGLSPSAAKEKGARLNAFAPLRIKLTMEGGTMLEYKLVEKAAFTVMGVVRSFDSDASYREIPKFWAEHTEGPMREIIRGMYGVCSGGDPFEYMIADNYIPWNEVPPGCVTRTIPAGAWAVFPCHGPMPDAIQTVNTRIWNEWLPACREYALGGSYDIEMYAPPCDNSEETYSEIWIPVKRI